MDITKLSNTLLEIFYIMIGLYMATTMVFTLKDKNHKTRIGTALFWGIVSAIFIFGKLLPPAVVGTLIIVIAILSALKQINIGTLKQLDTTFAQLKADKLGLKIFIPSLAIAFVAMAIAQFTKLSGTVAIGIAAVVALLLTFAFTKAKPIEYIEDSNRMFQSVGVFAILPQLLASLGALFTAAGVGDVISNIISGVIPDGNRLAGVIAYCVGMALFTAIMGNGLLCRDGIIYNDNGKCFRSILSNNSRCWRTVCICSRWRSYCLFSSSINIWVLWNIINTNGC